jgi:hypothetical protein
VGGFVSGFCVADCCEFFTPENGTQNRWVQLRRQVDGSSNIVDGHRALLPADLSCNFPALSQEVAVALLEQCQLGIAQDLAGDHMTPATKNMAMTTKIPSRKPLKKSSFMLHPAE